MALIVGTEGCRTWDVVRVISGARESMTRLQTKYQTVGLRLGVDDAFLQILRQNIIMGIDEIEFIIYRLLSKWVCDSGSNAKLIELIRILKEEGLTQCAELLQAHFQVANIMIGQQAQDIPGEEYRRPLQRCFKEESCAAERDLLLKIIINGVSRQTLFEKDLRECTFLHYLLKRGTRVTPNLFNQVVHYLIETKCATLFNVQGWRYNSPLHWLMCSLQPEVSTLYNLRCRGGVDFNVQDAFMDSTLAYAIYGKQSKELLFSLMIYGARWENVNKNRDTLLHHAARCGHTAAHNLLINLGADIEALNAEDETPVLHAVPV